MRKLEPSDKEKFCWHCGSSLGYDCGEAEPDYNQQFCSVGCYKKDINNKRKEETK